MWVMDPREMREYARAKPGAWEDQPWEGDRVAKVGPKIFAFLGDATVGVKCGATRDEAESTSRGAPTSGSRDTPTTRASCPASAGTAGTCCAATRPSQTRNCWRPSTPP